MTSREFRNISVVDGILTDGDRPGNFAKVRSGEYAVGKINVSGDGTIIISPDAYADDVIAFVYGTIKKHPGISDDIKDHLKQFVDKMDDRAVAHHGYSNSSEEKQHVWRR